MLVSGLPHLTCPHDGGLLTRRGSSYVCPKGHSFDRASEGYVNLLPVQDKASRDPGDSKAMVAARQRFLASGAYAPIAAALADAVMAEIAAHAADRAFTILDAGCGEGAYLAHLCAVLAAHPSPSPAGIHLGGIDISKWAVRAAAKRDLPATFAVASNRRPPLPPGSCDLILCVFGFPIWPGFAAVQTPYGTVLMIDPGPDHLLEMREIIYPQVVRRDDRLVLAADGYRQKRERRLTAKSHVASAALIADLLSMTPHAHRAKPEGQALLARRTSLDITIDVVLRLFSRDGG